MVAIFDPATQWALMIVVSVVTGTFLLIAIALVRRWQQIRYSHYVHSLQLQYRPVLAKVLSGARSPAYIETLRELPLAHLEILLEPLFSRRRLPERCLVFFQALCFELGLIEVWQNRLATGHRPPRYPEYGAHHQGRTRSGMPLLLRAKSIRNLGALRHRPSWPLLVGALDDRRTEVQFVALRAFREHGRSRELPGASGKASRGGPRDLPIPAFAGIAGCHGQL